MGFGAKPYQLTIWQDFEKQIIVEKFFLRDIQAKSLPTC
jgi:hypothetical protein